MKKAVTKSIYQVASRLEDSGARTLQPGNRVGFFVGPQEFVLFEDNLVEYEAILKRLLGAWSEKFSESFVDERIKAAMAEVAAMARDPANSGTVIQRITEHLDSIEREFVEFSEEQTVFLPLLGLLLHVPVLDIGGVQIRILTADGMTRLDAFAGVPFPEVDEDTLIRFKHHKQQETDKLRLPFVVYRFVAEPNRARELAFEEARKVLDILAYVSRAYGDMRVCLYGEKPSFTSAYTIDGNGGWQAAHSIVESPVPLTIDERVLKHMADIGVHEISNIIRDAQPTDFDKAVLRSLHWFADATRQRERVNQLLSLITCLEVFFSDSRTPVTATVAEGCALLLGQTFEQRKRIKADVNELYGARSGVSHGGDKTVTETQLERLTGLAGELLLRLVRRRDVFKTRKDLAAWLEEQRLTPPTR